MNDTPSCGYPFVPAVLPPGTPQRGVPTGAGASGAHAGGGIVKFPAGKYLSGPLTLHSRINLRLDDGRPFGAAGARCVSRGGHTNAQTFTAANDATDLEFGGHARLMVKVSSAR